jgi:ankyrin repeat protein
VIFKKRIKIMSHASAPTAQTSLLGRLRSLTFVGGQQQGSAPSASLNLPQPARSRSNTLPLHFPEPATAPSTGPSLPAQTSAIKPMSITPVPELPKDRFFRAVNNNEKEIVENFLLDSAPYRLGAQEKSDVINQAVGMAAENGSEPLLNLLRGFGGDTTWKDPHGNTAFHRAAKGGNTKIFKSFLVEGADVFSPNNEGQSPFDLISGPDKEKMLEAVCALHPTHEAVLRYINTRPSSQEAVTPTSSSSVGSSSSIQTTEAAHKYAPTDEEFITSSLEKAKMMLAEYGVKGESIEEIKSWAVSQQPTELSLKLKIVKATIIAAIKTGAFPRSINNPIDEKGNTVLCLASQNGYINLVNVCLECGADRVAPNSQKQTPLQLAQKGAHTLVIEALSKPLRRNSIFS